MESVHKPDQLRGLSMPHSHGGRSMPVPHLPLCPKKGDEIGAESMGKEAVAMLLNVCPFSIVCVCVCVYWAPESAADKVVLQHIVLCFSASC